MNEQKGKVGRFGFPGIGCVICLWLIAFSPVAVAGEVSIAVKENINTLIQTKSCPGCDLSGADLNRLDLSGANLEGADLSGAKIFLADLTNVNLKKAKLRGAGFGGTDMAGADLRGADLRGVDLSGAYLDGAKIDGEFITTTPFEKEGITDIQKEVYVEDTVKPKEAPASKDVKISKRRDFQETGPAAKAATVKKEVQKPVPPPAPTMKSPLHWKDAEQDSPAVKKIKPVADVKIKTAPATDVIQKDTRQQELSSTPMVAAVDSTSPPFSQQKVVNQMGSVEDQQGQSDGVSPLKGVEKKKVPEPPAQAIVSSEEKVADQEESQGFWASVKQSLGLEENKSRQSGEEANTDQDKSTESEKPVTPAESSEVENIEEKSTDQQQPAEPVVTATVTKSKEEEQKQEESQGFWASVKQSLGLDENKSRQSGEEANIDQDNSTELEKPVTPAKISEVEKVEEKATGQQQPAEPVVTATVTKSKDQEQKQEESGDLWESIKKSFGAGQDDAPASEEKSEEEQQSKLVESTQPETTETVAEKKEPKSEDQQSEGFWSSIKKSFAMSNSDDAAGEQKKQESQAVQVLNPVTDRQIKEEDIGPQTERTDDTSVAEAPALPRPEEKLLAKLQEKKRCYHCDFSGRDLSGMDLEEADLEGSDFSNANLTNVNLEGANLRATRFVQANLRNANMQDSDLYKSNLAGADLTGADLKDAQMDEADVSGVIGMQVESVLVEKK